MSAAQFFRPTGVRVEAAALAGSWIALTALCLLGSMVNSDVDIALYGSLACLIVTVPALGRTYEWLSPWSMVMLAVYMGCGIRGFAILEAGLSDPAVVRLYTRGRPLAEYFGPAMLVLAGFTMLAVGYAVGRAGARASNPVKRFAFHKGVTVVILLCALVGLYAFWRYAEGTGGLDLSHISAKRTAYYGDASYAGGQGQWRTVNQLSTLALLMLVARNAVRRDGASALSRYVLVPALFLNAALLPVYSSTRSQVILILLQTLVVQASLRPVGRSVVVRLGALALGLLTLLTFWRQQSEGREGGFSPASALRALSDAAVLNLNFTEIPKAVNIIEAVRAGVLPLSRGETIVNYVVAPIPRSWWPGKPIVDPGVEVGVILYRTDGTAVPPGVVAEAYWAFGAVGLVGISFLVGWLMRRLHERYRPRRGDDDMGRALMYSTVVFPFGFNAVSGSLGYAAMTSIIWAVMVWMVLTVAGQTSRDARPQGRTASALRTVRSGTEPVAS